MTKAMHERRVFDAHIEKRPYSLLCGGAVNPITYFYYNLPAGFLNTIVLEIIAEAR